MKTISITVSGHVQGVFFRQTTREIAEQLDVKGQVENLPNGDVYLIATGEQSQLDKLVAWCRKGPAKAVVENIVVKELEARSFDRFSVIRH